MLFKEDILHPFIKYFFFVVVQIDKNEGDLGILWHDETAIEYAYN